MARLSGWFFNLGLHGKLAVICATVIVVPLIMIAVTLPFNYEVIQKGQLLDYTNGKIYELRLYDSFNVFLEPEIKPNKDFFTGMVLAAIAFISITFAVCLHMFGLHCYETSRDFFVTTAAGFLFLAADELLGIHESIGHNLPHLSAIPGIQRPDDFIIISYGLIALLVLFYFRKMLWEHRKAGRWFVVATLLFGVSAVADTIGFRYEEHVELLGAIFLLVGIMDLGMISLGAQILQRRDNAVGDRPLQ